MRSRSSSLELGVFPVVVLLLVRVLHRDRGKGGRMEMGEMVGERTAYYAVFLYQGINSWESRQHC